MFIVTSGGIGIDRGCEGRFKGRFIFGKRSTKDLGRRGKESG